MLRQLRKASPFILVFFLFALSLALFHQHTEGGHTEDCGACRLVQTLIFFVAGLFLIFILKSERARNFPVVRIQEPARLFLSSTLKDRAPPA